jgi:hypothetical protein
LHDRTIFAAIRTGLIREVLRKAGYFFLSALVWNGWTWILRRGQAACLFYFCICDTLSFLHVIITSSWRNSIPPALSCRCHPCSLVSREHNYRVDSQDCFTSVLRPRFCFSFENLLSKNQGIFIRLSSSIGIIRNLEDEAHRTGGCTLRW